MSIFQSIILGVLQGIAEFLPISSSGHLKVAQELLGLGEVPLLFDVMLHLATLAAVILYFRKKIARLFVILFRWILPGGKRKTENGKMEVERGKLKMENEEGKAFPSATMASPFSPTPSPRGIAPKTPEADLLTGTDELGRKTILAVIVATIVTGAIGVVTSKLIPELPVKVTCAGFLFTACLLIFSAKFEKRKSARKSDVPFDSAQGTLSQSGEVKPKGISILQALFIGFMQGVGTLPGVSRSGSTIAGAQLAGVNRAAAGEFSFIVSIPAILGAFVLEAKDLGEVGSQIGVLPVFCGCLAAFAWGYLSLSILMKLIRRGKLEWFACYLIPLGILGLIFF
ncbi:MAG: undecaprenyl-diphosphate phosphatase [Treponema sp.]|uniref:undecaprenyl-diphosphate phosphatase n=1 Tax=Treponema sp. TaxID=166 RepID=UPI002A90F586|nr:undecaprenyl-diphosphate phosphatase [Treponema sp.]MDY6396720.1 undecaprenyl-diphosphate phosphatase [Treponema sp.]